MGGFSPTLGHAPIRKYCLQMGEHSGGSPLGRAHSIVFWILGFCILGFLDLDLLFLDFWIYIPKWVILSRVVNIPKWVILSRDVNMSSQQKQNKTTKN